MNYEFILYLINDIALSGCCFKMKNLLSVFFFFANKSEKEKKKKVEPHSVANIMGQKFAFKNGRKETETQPFVLPDPPA